MSFKGPDVYRRLPACALAAALLATPGQAAFAQEKVYLDGANFWEATIDGFDAGQAPDGTSLGFEVSGRLGDASERPLFSFSARDRGDGVTLTLETSGLGSPIDTLTVVSAGGSSRAVPLDPLERIAIEVPGAQRSWCNPFQGCRFEFWRRRNAVEQAFTFASPVEVEIGGRSFEARKLLFASTGIPDGTPDFSAVTLASTTAEPIRLRDMATRMAPMPSDGLLHDVRGDAGAKVADGVLRVEPFAPGERFDLAIEPGVALEAWHGRASIGLGGAAGGRLSMQADVRFDDGSLVPIAFMDAEVVQDGTDRRLRLAGGFDTPTYRLVALDAGGVVADLAGLSAGQVAVDIGDFDCDIVPEFYENCPRFGFQALPQHDDVCAWELQLAAPLRARVFDADGTASDISASTFLLIEEHPEAEAGDTRYSGPMVFSRITMRGTGIDTLGLFDQTVAPARARPGYAGHPGRS